MMFGLSQIGPNQQYLILPFITIGSSMTEVTLLAGYGTALMDMAPNFLGILYGVSYSIGLTPGAFMPLIIAALTPNVIGINLDQTIHSLRIPQFRELRRSGGVSIFYPAASFPSRGSCSLSPATPDVKNGPDPIQPSSITHNL